MLKVIKRDVALFAVLAMLIGFFTSRAVLSMAMILLGITGLAGISPRQWLKQGYWLAGLGWIGIFLISFFWSSDSDYWKIRCEVKLPVLLLPLAFAFLPPFTGKQKRIFTLTLNLLLLAGVAYSLYFLFSNPAYYIKAYDYSQVLPTLLEGDHIIFSLTMAVAVIWNIYFFPFIRPVWERWFCGFSILAFIIMLHVLAARTGLVAFYIFMIGWCIYLAFSKVKKWVAFGLITAFLVSGVLAFKFVPTLKNRVDHTSYTLIMFQEGNMSGDYSDIGRYISYDLAVKIIREHPFTGVGAGDIMTGMKEKYGQYYPHIPQEQMLVPHNQFLTVGVGGGIPALLLFMIWVFYPLWGIRKTREGFFFFILWLVMMVPLMVDAVLEIQFGVFVYLFFLLWQRHEMIYPENNRAVKS